MQTHYPASGPVRLIFALGVLGWTAGSTAAAVFTIDPAQSAISLSGSALTYPLQEQAAGSLTTRFDGSLNADVTDVSIAFTGASVLSAHNSGDWQPKANGDDGGEPANYGGTASAGFASALAALRNIQFDVTSPPLAINGGTFDSGSVAFLFPTNSQGALDYKISGLVSKKGRLPLAGVTTNKVATQATLSTSGSTQTLTIPIAADFFFKLVSANDTKLTLTGQLVATRTLGGAGETFVDWLAAKFPGITDPNIVGPGADPDHDGLPNIVEFAFGLDPSVPNPASVPLKVGLNPADPSQRTLEFIRPRGLGGVTYLLQVSADLTTWANLTATPQIIDLGNGQEKVVVTDTAPLNSNSSRFILLSVGAN